ncbi:hypothetical protein A2876_04035 [Candidatus Amesbacteria bacterium RIFCSPHIGHO2_01_FULL_48_32b]|uniref:Uncharacterized protein n=1 Tax=Candidatus Amesbacteria bacterium RIFCSPHIGHO2_01_FULL_48_32b TaxID=1797253 RepID=A0A1F4YEY5_9BACT|nr:MAG: hypothetical protein A2876_04035 [Candidatus Amesbacteria bacterium RIFCSPHIGHO2_01_FULL_48_32b]
MKFLRRRAVIFLLIGLGMAGFWWWRNSRESSNDKNMKVAVVERKDVRKTLVMSGKIVAGREASLRFFGVGKLGYVKVAGGDRIKKGQAVMGLDARDAAAVETAAYYSYAAADANAKEIEDQVKGHDKDETFAQKNDRVTAQTARDKAYDAWQTAVRARQNANLISPIDGVVVNITVTVAGETVGVADGVDIVDPESLYFESEVDETELNLVGVGKAMEVTLDAYPDEKLEGEITSIDFSSHESDAGATVFSVRVKILSEEDIKILRVGMNGDAALTVEEAKGVLVLPIEAVGEGEVELPGGQRQRVEIGLEGDEEVEIKSGVVEGQKVWYQ